MPICSQFFSSSSVYLLKVYWSFFKQTQPWNLSRVVFYELGVWIMLKSVWILIAMLFVYLIHEIKLASIISNSHSQWDNLHLMENLIWSSAIVHGEFPNVITESVYMQTHRNSPWAYFTQSSSSLIDPVSSLSLLLLLLLSPIIWCEKIF